MGKAGLFTTSWDDGHPLDMRVAELLNKHGLPGTFYVPGRVAPGGCCNPEGFEVLPKTELRQLGTQFEIGSHTLDHKSLHSLPAAEARHQIEAGKRWLEDQLGRGVAGFCYPNGHHDAAVRKLVRDCGFSYGRTTEDLSDDVGMDPFQMPVSLHFHPRGRIDVARGFVREERRRLGEMRWLRRLPVFLAAIAKDDFEARVRCLVDRVCERGGVFHVWGHSWEIDRFGGWTLLDDVLRYAAERVPLAARVTNEALASGMSATGRLQPAV
jgi:peptidoglycan/xylan/chitin deacetylase (PgdA/CDA1 family)